MCFSRTITLSARQCYLAGLKTDNIKIKNKLYKALLLLEQLDAKDNESLEEYMIRNGELIKFANISTRYIPDLMKREYIIKETELLRVLNYLAENISLKT